VRDFWNEKNKKTLKGVKMKREGNKYLINSIKMRENGISRKR
jgi:hypothetical protein